MLLPTCQLISARHYSTLLCAATESMRLGLLVLFFLGDGVTGAKILALFPFPFYSHTHTFIPVFKELAARGHHLTFLSPYPQVPAPQNWTNILIDKKPFLEVTARAVREMTNASKYRYVLYFWDLCLNSTELFYKDQVFKALVDSSDAFDLIITEPLFCHESLTALGARLNTPVVGVFPLSLNAWASYFTGSDFLPSYIPDYRTHFTHQMTFFQRLDNTLLTTVQLLSGFNYYLPKQESLMKKYIYPNSSNHPSLTEILRGVALTLVDTHYSVTYPRSFQPHIIPVAGLSNARSENLPKDLHDFMDEAPNGVIYINFGSLLPMVTLSPHILQAFLAVFRKADMRVLMKWENDTLANKPPNMIIRKWFPQTCVLAHPKCRVFVTHGGLHGISEAIHNAVPIIGIPFFNDQVFNVMFSEAAGFGYTLNSKDITADSFQQAIHTVLNNKSYRENALRRSKVMRDQPDSALNTAVYWIEYTLRHKDLSHLRPASTGLLLYQLYLLDVFAFILICILTVLIVVHYSLKMAGKLLLSKIRTKRKID